MGKGDSDWMQKGDCNAERCAAEWRRPADVRMGWFSRVAGMQAKLHCWAAADPGRRFDDLFNLVYDPATLIVAFDRVAGNRGANTAGRGRLDRRRGRPATSVSEGSWTMCVPGEGRGRSGRCRCGSA